MIFVPAHRSAMAHRCERFLRFALNVILYLRTVKNLVETMDIKRKLFKVSTSSRANYEDSQGSPTKQLNSSLLKLGAWKLPAGRQVWGLGLFDTNLTL